MSLKIYNLIIQSKGQLNAVTMSAVGQESQLALGRATASVPEKIVYKPDEQ
jgi:hypothetical protein